MDDDFNEEGELEDSSEVDQEAPETFETISTSSAPAVSSSFLGENGTVIEREDRGAEPGMPVISRIGIKCGIMDYYLSWKIEPVWIPALEGS
eukprot:gene2347-2569_t